MKRAITILLCLTMILSAAACSPKKPDEEKGAVDVWGAPATEKILADKPGEYSGIRTAAEINLLMAKNEYESGQIIMTPDYDVKSYDVTVSALTHSNGTDTIPAENVEVFVEKYLSLGVVYDTAGGAVPGKYPDALLPFSAAKEHGENTIEKNTNQGLYVTVKTAENQAPGSYTGAIKLTVDGEETSVPVTVNVADLTVSEENHAKSIFLSVRLFESGELEGSQDIMDKYTRRLIDYRLSPHIIVTDTKHTPDDIKYYADKAYEFMKDPRCSNISIPYATTFLDGETCFDPEIMKAYVREFVRKSVEENFDMLKKSVCYMSIIDEPQLLGMQNRVAVVARYYRSTVEALATEAENDPAIPDGELKTSIVKSIRSLRNVVTCDYLPGFAASIDTWCPQVQHYDTESERANYANQEEKWWYTCSSPRVPYPTYHTEDTLLSARALSWMQAEYGVTGNLFWAVNNYADYNGSYYENIEDYYTGDAQRFVTVNGDGYLFYPGAQYGLDKPVASLRIEAIRDGMEEYELLYAMKNRYAEIAAVSGLDFGAEKAIAGLSSAIYSGTKVTTTSAKFMGARSSLFSLAECASSEAGMCVTDYFDDGYGTITYKVFMKSGYSLRNHGNEVTEFSEVNGGRIYVIRTALTGESNTLELTFDCSGETYGYTQNLGGKATTHTAESLVSTISAGSVTPVVTAVGAAEVGEQAGSGKLAKIAVPATTEKSQSVKMTAVFIEELSSSVKKAVMHVYNPSDENVKLSVSVKYSKKTTLIDLASVELKPGMNEIELPTGAINWTGLGKAESMTFIFGDTKNEAARTIYLGDLTVYNE